MANNNKTKQPEDIFADVNKSAKKPQIKRNYKAKSQTEIPLPSDPEAPLSNRLKYIIIIVAVLILVLAGVVYVVFIRENGDVSNENLNNSNVDQVNINSVLNNSAINSGNVNTNSGTNASFLNAAANMGKEVVEDTDRDGLTDVEEAEYGTDKTLSDTDNDGLSDKQEIVLYKSDPKDSDTDNDGFNDGEEVEAGYDPAGPGELYDINQVIK